MKTADGIERAGSGVDAAGEAAGNPPAGSVWSRLRRELRTHPFGYVVLAIFMVAGPVLAPFAFPQAPPAVAVIGGLAFGAYAALCAVPQKFL